MPSPSHQDTTAFEALEQQTGFSSEAIESMRRSIVDGGGRMAQFDHPEFGGPGQWMQGGLLMVSDFSDAGLKRRVARLCDALADSGAVDARPALARRSSAEPAAKATWYPPSLGTPDTSGAQNGTRYAWFGHAGRLAVDDGRTVTVYDTGDHRIGGVSQQQGTGSTVSFVSQHGLLDLTRLPVVDGAGAPARRAPDASPEGPAADAPAATADSRADPFAALEKLAGLHRRGIVDDDEFATKKAELLRRI